MKKAIYIISFEEDGRHGYGPYKTVEFSCVNSSYPKVKNDTVTFSVQKMNGEYDFITVSVVHNIQTEP